MPRKRMRYASEVEVAPPVKTQNVVLDRIGAVFSGNTVQFSAEFHGEDASGDTVPGSNRNANVTLDIDRLPAWADAMIDAAYARAADVYPAGGTVG